MFYHIFKPIADVNILFNVFRYFTFRSVAAFVTALVFSVLLGPYLINALKKKQFVETINDVVPTSHKSKQGTPSMGGLIILSSMMLASLLWNNLVNTYVLFLYLTVLWLGGLGFLDDYLKNIKKLKKGLVAKYKLLGQITLSLIIGLALYFGSEETTSIASISLPFFKETAIYLGIIFIPFVVFVIVGTSNAVNLTDGLDGLAAGTISIAGFAFAAMAYFKGNSKMAEYFHLEFIPQAGEITIFLSALTGSTIGFLWFNTKPAEIFMGDTGSLSLGGLLAVVSILLREEIFLVIVGGIFIMEALSSIMQRYYFKYTRKKYGTGRRIFKMAPLHHHFELKGLSEEKIVVRFWIVALILAALGIGTIKLR